MQVFTLKQVCKERAEQTLVRDSSVSSSSNSSDPPHSVASEDLSTHTQLRLHDVLRLLVTLSAQTSSLEELLSALASLIQQVTRVDLCVVLLPDMQGNILEVRYCLPDLSDRGVLLQNIHIEYTLLQRLHNELLRGHIPSPKVYEYHLLNPLENVQFETLLTLPLFVSDECIGVINCYAQKSMDYNNEDQLILATIASQAAFAIQQARSLTLEKSDQHATRQAFMHDLLSGATNGRVFLERRARCLGYDLDAPHVVIAMEMQDSITSSEASEQQHLTEEQQHTVYQCIQAQVQDTYPGSLVAMHGSELLCLLRMKHETDIEQIIVWFKQLIHSIKEEQLVSVLAGVSNPCASVDRYRFAYAEAQEACEIGPYLAKEGHCTPYRRLGAYRYIYDFARANKLPDLYQEQIALIQEYDDQHKSTFLLPTLEIYLECGTNISDAAHALHIHPNTLRQRLERLKSVCSLDLKQREHWLPLQITLKLHKLSGAKGPQRYEQRGIRT